MLNRNSRTGRKKSKKKMLASSWWGTMTLRDWLAAHAMRGFMEHVNNPETREVNWCGPEDFERVAKLSYDMADAMLEAREAGRAE